MVQNLKDIKVEVSKPIPILCDNTNYIKISNNIVMRSHTKHIEIRYQFLHEKVLNNEVVLEYVSTKY
jgi:hypothetical protein